MIQLNQVSKSYNTKTGTLVALKEVSLSVPLGGIFGVIGRSGAGKSTLIRCINLLERPTCGSVQVNGQELTTLSNHALRQARHRIGMIFQNFNLLSTRTVYDNVALPLQLLKKTQHEIEQVVHPLLELTGLEHRVEAYPSQLSGGQKQRVAIARALSTKPTILLCDEMTSALDPETTASILDLIKSIHQKMKLSILLITHEMQVIKSIADQIAVLENGRIVEQSDVVSLFKMPKTNITKTFVESVFNSKLPVLLQKQLHSERMPKDHIVIRITFSGHKATEPMISEWLRQFRVCINILQANLECLRADMIGMMIVTVAGEVDETQRAIQALKEKKLTLEVLGYVAADDPIFA